MSHASEVSIANEALLLLGANTITSFDDDDSNAVLVDRFYHTERDAILRSHRWNCAIETANLASLSTTPIIDWKYQFTLPVDPYCLRVLDVRTVTGDIYLDFAIQGRKLLTEESAVDITYVKRVEDPSSFDALLYQTIVFRLAWKRTRRPAPTDPGRPVPAVRLPRRRSSLHPEEPDSFPAIVRWNGPLFVLLPMR